MENTSYIALYSPLGSVIEKGKKFRGKNHMGHLVTFFKSLLSEAHDLKCFSPQNQAYSL